MFCTKCGKEIPDGEKKVCDECEKNLVEAIVAEEKVEQKVEEKQEEKKEVKKEKASKKEKTSKKAKKENAGSWEVSGKKDKKGLAKKLLLCAVTIACVALVICLMSILLNNATKEGNTIGNIRNYGYAAENNGWIYYLAPNEDSTQIGIFKVKNNGEDKQQLYMSELDIVSINVYKNHIYFIGSSTQTYKEDDELDNKIYRMKTDGTNLEVLNDNELNNECYEIYVINDQVYYIGLNAEICKMNLNGSNKTVLADNGTGFLGITEEYIIYNTVKSEDDVEYITYIMNLDGTNPKPIIEGKRLYSVNIEGDYVYYSDANKKLYRTEIGSNAEETLYENISVYNLNTNDGYAYYLNYLDSENDDYTVCLYRVNLDGTTETPEKIKELSSYSSFIDVVGDWVFYMDNSEEAGFITLVNKTGNGKEIELYRLDYAAYYESLDLSEVETDTTSEDTTDESTDATTDTEKTSETTENSNVIEFEE